MTPTSPQELDLYRKELRCVVRDALVHYPDGRHVVGIRFPWDLLFTHSITVNAP